MTEQDEQENHLTRLLEDAADERPGALARFYQELLRSRVWVPTTADPTETPGGILLVSSNQAEQHGLRTVHYDGKECVVIFSEKEFVEVWAASEVPCIEESFSTLLWRLGDDCWMYLNPNQELGKEITPWEIQHLRRGEAAVEELVEALSDDPYPEYEIRSSKDLFPELKRQLLPVLEIARGLEEAFLIAIREDDEKIEKPMIGLRYSENDPSIRQYIRGEIRITADEFSLESGALGEIMIVDDLDSVTSPNRGLFEDATPFYVAARSLGATGTIERVESKIRGAIRSFFSPSKDNSQKNPEDSDN